MIAAVSVTTVPRCTIVGNLPIGLSARKRRRLVLALGEVDRHDAIRRACLLEHPMHHLRSRSRIVIENDVIAHHQAPLTLERARHSAFRSRPPACRWTAPPP